MGIRYRYFPHQAREVRGVGEESRKGGGGVKAENLLQFRDIFDLSSPEPTVTITQSKTHKFQAYYQRGIVENMKADA